MVAQRAPTPAQEVANAVTMFAPLSAMLVVMCLHGWWERWPANVVFFATLVHAPVSATYHIRCALKLDKERLGNAYHRSDQTMNHVVCASCAIALQGSSSYALSAAGFNAVSACLLWRPSPTASSSPFVHARLFCGSMLYLLPIGWHEGWGQFGIALALFILAVTLFALSPGPLRGFGHAISHLVMAPLGLLVLQAAAWRA